MTATTLKLQSTNPILGVLSRLFRISGFGSARFVVVGGELQHEESELSFQFDEKRETVEAFVERVKSFAYEHDAVIFRFKNRQVYQAVITRAEDVPLRKQSGETFEAFAVRAKAYKNAPRA